MTDHPYHSIERNEMTVRNVLVDTKFVMDGVVQGIRSKRSPTYVIGLKRCGCTGPLLGHVQPMSKREVESAIRRRKKVPEKPEGATTLWVGYAIEYNRPMVYAWGENACARALRNWWGVTNIRGRVKRSEKLRSDQLEQKHAKRSRLKTAA